MRSKDYIIPAKGVRITLAVTVQVEAASGAVLVLNAGNPDVGNRHLEVGTAGMVLGHRVAGRDGKIDGELRGLAARILTCVKQRVPPRPIQDVKVSLGFSLPGIHTNTSFLNVPPLAYAR